MDGYEVARRVRQLPALGRTRLIAMTGYGQDSDPLNAEDAGFDACLVKPVDYAELMKTIDNLERKSSQPSAPISASPASPTSSSW
jgi:CheY-like chemotaxis protein